MMFWKRNFYLILPILITIAAVFGVNAADDAGKTPPVSEDAAVQLGGTVVGGEFVKWPMAVPKLRNFGSMPDTEGLAKLGQQILINDLSISGVFDILDERSFVEDPKKSGITEATTDFNAWLNIGAHGLIKGGIWIKKDTIKVDLRLFDVALQKQVVAKEYEASKDKFRYIMHRFASEVLKYFTKGKLTGIYNTKIVCVRKSAKGKNIYVMDFDGAGGYYLTNNSSLNLLPTWDFDGSGVFFTSYVGKDPDLYLVRLSNPKDMVKISGRPGLDMGAAVSPDGKKIALVLTKDDNAEIYVMNRDGSGLKRLTHSWGIDVSPSWSPDGKKIAFISNRSGNPHVYIMNADGSQQERLTFVGNYNQSPAWSPKGDEILFVGRDERYVFDIFKINVKTRDITRLTQDQKNNESPSWSPDGRHIVFASDRSGEYKLYIMNADGSNQRRITRAKGEFTSPSWSPYLPWK